MSENDLIAEYVKERYPELLGTFDFVAYKLNACARKSVEILAAQFAKIDFSAAQEATSKLAYYLSLANATENIPPLDCTGCKYERSTDIMKHVKFCNFCRRSKTDAVARENHEDLFVKKMEVKE